MAFGTAPRDLSFLVWVRLKAWWQRVIGSSFPSAIRVLMLWNSGLCIVNRVPCCIICIRSEISCKPSLISDSGDRSNRNTYECEPHSLANTSGEEYEWKTEWSKIIVTNSPVHVQYLPFRILLGKHIVAVQHIQPLALSMREPLYSSRHRIEVRNTCFGIFHEELSQSDQSGSLQEHIQQY